MVTRTSTESVRHQAQDLAYKAMGARDPEETLRLCKKALEIDPRCVDALVIMAGEFGTDERIAHLACVVKIAEEDLGGNSYFDENRGHFWGLLETRPYMRARSYLAQTLHETGRIDEAIAEYEALLDLNPDDNQGLRYVLIGLYLEADNLDGVRRLQIDYGDEASAVFAWSAVLERLISGDMAGAQQALVDARDVNPYVEGYLLGRKPMPSRMPDHYGFGDESEAVVSMDVIGDAWKEHSEAMRWLRQHEAPTEIAAKVKVGRNDPCPCGSGKKYKKCCLGRENTPLQAVGSPVAAEMALNDIMQEMKGREFSSQEEMQAFVREINQQRNRKPIDDFEGLSSGQMHRFINFPFDSPDVVEFVSTLDTPPSAPITALFALLVDAIGEDGLKPTAKGNLPLKVVHEAAQRRFGSERPAEMPWFGRIRSEEDFHDLHVTRIVAELAGLIRKYKGKFILSRECRKLLKAGGMSAIYPVLLRTFAEKFNWGYRDYYPDNRLIQSFFVYTLYLLGRHGDQWRRNTLYEDAFIRAFPSIVDTVESATYRTREETIRGMYSQRCLRTFAEFLGLIETKPNPEDRLGRIFELRKTPLLGDAVRFHLST